MLRNPKNSPLQKPRIWASNTQRNIAISDSKTMRDRHHEQVGANRMDYADWRIKKCRRLNDINRGRVNDCDIERSPALTIRALHPKDFPCHEDAGAQVFRP